MRLNSFGVPAMGVGGVPGSVNQELVPNAYGPWWMTDELVVAGASDNPGDIISWNFDTESRIVIATDTILNDIRGGGGYWSGWGPAGVISSWGLSLPEAGLYDMGPDGSVAIKPVYQSNGGGVVYEVDATEPTFRFSPEDEPIYDVQLLGNRKVIWTTPDGVIHTHGLPGCVQVSPPNAHRPRAFKVGTEWWVCYWDSVKGTIVHPFASTMGYIAVPIGTDAFYHDAIYIEGFDQIMVAWSARGGEVIEDYRDLFIDLTDDRISLGEATAPVGGEAVSIVLVRAGFYAAPVWTPSGWRVLAGDHPTLNRLLVYDMTGTIVGQLDGVDGSALNYLRAASAPDGTICFVAQSVSDKLIIGSITPEGVITADMTATNAFGQSGVNVRYNEGDFTIYSLTDADHYVEIRGVAGTPSAPIAAPNTTQGWIDVFGGQMRWIDLYRDDPANQMLYPTILNGVMLGQDASSAGDGIVGIVDGARFRVYETLGMEPTLAVNEAGTEWAWSARLLGSQVVFGTFPPFGDLDIEVPGEGGGGVTTTGTYTLKSSGTFPVAGLAEEVVELPIQIFPAFPNESGYGRLIHPTLGAFDYEVKPDEWVNIDADAIIPPMWSSSRTLTSAANVLWQGNLRDVMVEERWKALGGLAMPITQLRMLLAVWTNPIDPDIGYVFWYPNYITQVGFKVLVVNVSVGGQGIALDDVTNYKDEDGEPIGWVTSPVTVQLKLVERL